MARMKSRDHIRFLVSLIITVSTITVLISYWFLMEVGSRYRRKRKPDFQDASYNPSGRKLLATNLTKNDIRGEYPEDLFSLEDKRKGAVVFHIFGISYMFLGLAIVCDEFFVPTLHVISGLLKISDDVAGATFMAAGGSAPELFTSLLGVFVANSDVGFGTIVGSAVFNVLFVIAMCVFFSKGLLRLTWWPLLRDCSFYVLSLALLISFFKDSRIQLWESSILFFVYFLYVLFMAINVKAEKFVKRLLSTVKGIGNFVKQDARQEKGKNLIEFGGACFRHGAFQLVVHTLDPITEVPMNKKLSIIREIIESSKETDEGYFSERRDLTKPEDDHTITNPSQNDTSFAGEAMINNYFHKDNQRNAEASESSLVATPSGQFHTTKTFGSVDYLPKYDNHVAQDGDISTHKSRHRSLDFGKHEGIRYKKHSLADDVSMEIFSDSYFDSKSRIETRGKSKPSYVDQILVQGKKVEKDLMSNELSYKDSPCSDRSLSVAYSIPAPITTNSFDHEPHPRSGSKLSCTSHHGMSRVCLREAAAEAQGTTDEEDEEPLSLKWPDTLGARIYYIIKFPIVICLFFTIPDVRRPGWSRFFPLSFFNSIVWIGGFSYFMLWWAALIGQTLRIPEEVMGLTFIAAGTSIPDLITSVLVARQGLGDMAISSSIGSNIFDVTVGLPVPWIIFSLTHSFGPMTVNSKGLFCSTVLLFFMLIAVVFLIAISKWKMTKTLGFAMLLLYVVFLTITLLIQFNIIKCLL